MRNVFRKLWQDDAGAILSIEMLFLAVVLVIGLIAGLSALRIAIVSELVELANAVVALDDSYATSGTVLSTGGGTGTVTTTGGQTNATTVNDTVGKMTVSTTYTAPTVTGATANTIDVNP